MPEKEPPKIKPSKTEAPPKKVEVKTPPKTEIKKVSAEVQRKQEKLRELTKDMPELAKLREITNAQTLDLVTKTIEAEQAQEANLNKTTNEVMKKLKLAIDEGKMKPTSEVINMLKAYALKTSNPDILPSVGGGAGPTEPQVYDETPGAEPLITDSDLIRKLREINFNLRTNSLYQNDIHRLNNDADSIGRLGLENKDIPEDQIKEATERINNLIIKANQAANEAREQVHGAFSKESKWSYIDKDPSGHPIPPEDETLTDGTVLHKDSLRKVLGKLNSLGDTARPDDLNQGYLELRDLIRPDGEFAHYADRVEPYMNRVKEFYETMRSERFHLNPDVIAKLMDPESRDEIFFERIKVVLDDPDTPSHKSMNLYKESELDAFMHAISRQIKPPQYAERLVRHFNNLKNAVFAFHDLDLQARSAAGDIKSFKGAAHYFQNAYAVQSLSDPLVESMMGCYEQALKMIRDNNNGYIPPHLVEYSPKTGLNYWDELTVQLFEKKVSAGLVFDYARDEMGFGKLDRDGRIFEKGRQLQLSDIKEMEGNKESGRYRLRMLATMRQAKGMGILNNHLLEIFAFSKTPGYDNPEYGTAKLVFSSKAYEGISRWMNPMGDFLGKYKMGDVKHPAYFASVIGGDIPMMMDFIRWSPHEWQEVVGRAAQGDLDSWMKDKYGEKAKRLLDATGEFAFSGRFGPLSGWGENDVTIDWTDLEREREGGAMRYFKAEWWADRELNAKHGDWAKRKLTPGGEKELATYARAYKTWIMIQTSLRNPTIVAGFVRDPSSTSVERKTNMPRKLRSVIIQEILGINIEQDVASEATPLKRNKELYGRIELLESDVMLVQQAALYGGSDGRPRDIQNADFNLITGSSTVKINGVDTEISQQMRRDQARQYVELVKSKMLGTWTPDQWINALGVTMDTGQKLTIANWKDIDVKLREAHQSHGAILSGDVIDKKQHIHMGLEDVQWRYLDLEALAPRQWARRANDLEARSNTVLAIINHLDLLKPKPDLKELGKSYGDIYKAEKEHDPNEAHKFVWINTRATGMIYRQNIWGEFPLLGKVISRFIPTSISQLMDGVEMGTAWSINNQRQHIHVAQQEGHLPYARIDAAGNIHPYSVQTLEPELVAKRSMAFAETVVLGYFITAMLVSGAAFGKSVEEETKH